MRDGKIKVNPYQYVFQSPTAPIKTEEDHAVVKDECFPIKSDADPIDTNDFRRKKIPKLVVPDSIPKDGAIGVAKHLLKLVLDTKSNETMTGHYKDVLISAALDLLKKACRPSRSRRNRHSAIFFCDSKESSTKNKQRYNVRHRDTFSRYRVFRTGHS